MTTRENVQLFSTHSYNIPAVGYKGKVESIDKILKANHPEGKTKPVIFTEIGRWMNAYLIDKYETMDSPSLFVEWAGTYTQNMQPRSRPRRMADLPCADSHALGAPQPCHLLPQRF